jgi:hypothetical protein
MDIPLVDIKIEIEIFISIYSSCTSARCLAKFAALRLINMCIVKVVIRHGALSYIIQTSHRT